MKKIQPQKTQKNAENYFFISALFRDFCGKISPSAANDDSMDADGSAMQDAKAEVGA
ncbi:MAG: hypothetical protein L3J62_10290 [Gammaproteobacteria bacterium]|nr:hypothetical protein [Gammaproteobacteria bacterium]